MKKEIIPVEPLSTYLENWKAPTSAVTRCGDTIYVSGFPPFDPETGKGIEAPIERQAELVLEQMGPGDSILLWSWRDEPVAKGFESQPIPNGAPLGRVRVVRDYDVFDRREAPQYYPEVKREV
jgi:hypothetical protein